MTNKEYLSNLGIKLTGVNQDDELMINSFLRLQDSKKIVVPLDDGRQIHLTKKYHKRAFLNEVWEKLSLSEKIKVAKWEQEEFLTLKGYLKGIPQFIFSDEKMQNISCSAGAMQEGLYINLESFAKFKGFDALATIVHECIHYLDFEKCEQILKEIAKDYLPKNIIENKDLTALFVMKLPVEGKIKNFSAAKMEFISKDLASKILLLKNYFVTINPEVQTPRFQKHVQSFNSFNKYLRKMAYFCSPLETHAISESVNYAKKIASAKYICVNLNLEDNEVLLKQEDQLKNLIGKKREVQKDYKISVINAINMELVHEFNLIVFNENKKRYILPELMEKRHKIYKHLWETKFAYYGKYEPWQK